MENTNFQRYSILSPRRVPEIVDTFIERYNSFNIKGIALSDMGGMIQSDFRENDVYNREESLRIIDAQTAKLQSNGYEIMADYGNAAVLGYASHVVNIPVTSSGFSITDRAIPFLQMVLRGYIDFAGEPLNLTDERNNNVKMLRLIETGSGVYFKLTHEKSEITKRTEYDVLCSTYYKDWLSVAVETYQAVNEALKEVRYAKIVNHEYLKNGVVYVAYDNGISFTINYNAKDEILNGKTIPAESYIREGK